MVSIIIPVYNGKKFIEKTVDSCISQTYKDIEILIIDDCSTDDTYSYLEVLKNRDDRIKLYKNEKNSGPCKTCNFGVSVSNGDYFLFLGQDDVLESQHIENMLKYMESDISIIYCNYELIDEDDIVFDSFKYSKDEMTMNDFSINNAIHSCGILINGKKFKETRGFPEFKKYPCYGEWYLWIEMLKIGRIILCDTVNSKYRRHKNNITNTFTSKKVQKGLNNYWNKCRILALLSGKLTVKQFIKTLVAVIYFNMKNIFAR